MTEPAERTSFLARHRFTLAACGLALGFLLLSGGSVTAGFVSGRDAVVAEHNASLTPPPTPEPGRATPSPIPSATTVRTCTIAPQAAAAALGTLRGSVLNPATAETLFSRTPTYASPVGSTMAALSAAAIVSQLGPDYQLTTSVVDNNSDGSIVLVGGGDATLSSLPDGTASVYAGAPTLADLAAATLSAYEREHPGKKITEVVLDSTYWDKADRWNATWNRDLQTGGSLSEVTALQVDGDRADPTAQTSPRSTDPIGRAGDAFVAALGLDPDKVTVREGSAPAGATGLAEVKSAPLSSLVAQMLGANDATLAEMLARVLSVQTQFGGSAASLQQAVTQALQSEGVDTAGVTVRDGSGLSPVDAVPTATMANLMTKIGIEENLAAVRAALPVAGQGGSLATRFTGANASAAGAVFAVSGAIDGVRSLAGIVTAADGSSLGFSFVATGTDITEATVTALDTLAAGVHTCGNNLTNN